MSGDHPQRPVLQADRLCCSYGGHAPVFEDLSLAIQPREIVALVGGSGCGKSSLLRVLAGLVPPQRGELRFEGRAQSGPHPRTALLFQQPSLLPWLRVEANVAFGLDFEHQPRSTRAERLQRTAAALQAVGLADSHRLYPAQLSGGMAQRVALARALAREPRLLLADEPFSALDAITRADMQTLLVDVVHRWGSAVLLVTHDLDEALRVADRVLLMGSGRLVGEWSVRRAGPTTDATTGTTTDATKDTASSTALAAPAALHDEILGALHSHRRQGSPAGLAALHLEH